MVINKLKNTEVYSAVIIIVFTVILYGNTVPNRYSLDDSFVTQNNPTVQKGIAGIPEILTSRYVDEKGNSFGYRPIAKITFAIGHELWGQNPHIEHLINVLIYTLILLILFKILRKIFKTTHILFLLAIVLLFAAHPIHTEVVDSLKNRETLLSYLFSLVSMSFFLRWYDARRILPAIRGCLFFILAFLSKQDAITFAAVIPLALYYYSNEPFPLSKWGGISLNTLFSKIFMLLAITSFVVFFYASKRLGVLASALSYFSTLGFLIIHYLREKPGGTTTTCYRTPFLFLGAGMILFIVAVIFSKSGFGLLSLLCFAIFFLRDIKFPEIPKIRLSKFQLRILVPLIILGITGIVFYQLPNLYLPAEDKIMYKFENPQFVNDPQYPTLPLAFYTLFFYLQKLVWPHPLGFYYGFKMIPEVGLTSPAVIFSIAFHIALLIVAFIRLRQKNTLSFAILYYLLTLSIFSNIIIKIPGIVGERMVFFSSLGFCIAVVWLLFRILSINLYTRVIPRPKIVQLILLTLLLLVPCSLATIKRNTQWKDYLTLFSHDISYLANSARANQAYANQLLKEAFNNEIKAPSPEVRHKYLELAAKHLTKAIEIDSTDKFSCNNLGYVTFQYLGEKQKGIGYMQKAIRVDPDYENAHFNLGFAYRQLGQFDQSIHHFEEAQRINPRNPVYLFEKADTYFKKGDIARAVLLNEEAAQLNPKSEVPHINIGNLFWLSQDTLKAIASWEKAFATNSNNLYVCLKLANYYDLKRDAKADFFKNKAVELQSRSKQKATD